MNWNEQASYASNGSAAVFRELRQPALRRKALPLGEEGAMDRESYDVIESF
jgi:hypothetical protein